MQPQPGSYCPLRLAQVIGLFALTACGPTVIATAPNGKSQAALDAERATCLRQQPITDPSMATYAQCMRGFGNTITVTSDEAIEQEANRAEQNAPVIYGREPTPQEHNVILSACDNWAKQQVNMQIRSLGIMMAGYWGHGVWTVTKTKDQLMADCWHKHVVL